MKGKLKAFMENRSHIFQELGSLKSTDSDAVVFLIIIKMAAAMALTPTLGVIATLFLMMVVVVVL